jgi:uncharacterized Fe-S center protein
MLKSVSLITAIIFGLAAGIAQAETPVATTKFIGKIVAAEGKVLLNQGQGFFAASAQTPLSVGDQLMVGTESSAVVAYGASDCKLTVSAGSLLRITAEPPCKKGESLAMAGQTFVTPTAFEGVFAGSNVNARLLALAPVAVVAGIVLYAASTYKEPGPASTL